MRGESFEPQGSVFSHVTGSSIKRQKVYFAFANTIWVSEGNKQGEAGGR